jgi:hypothetical protein
MRRTKQQRREWKHFIQRLQRIRRRARLEMAKEIDALLVQRKEIAGRIMGWRRQISDLKRSDQQDGIGLGMSPDAAWMKRKVDRHNEIARLEVDAVAAEERLAKIDRKLAVIEADDAEAKVRDAVQQLQTAATPAAWAQLRDGLMMLSHHRRIGQSSVMILRKIERLSQPGTTHGVRVRENVSDFLTWIRPAAEAA